MVRPAAAAAEGGRGERRGRIQSFDWGFDLRWGRERARMMDLIDVGEEDKDYHGKKKEDYVCI